MIRYDRRSIALAVSLSCLAGYVDAIGYLSAGNFFVSFMSGNSTRLGIGLGEGRFRYALVASGAVVLFVAGVVLGTVVSRKAGLRRRPAVLFLVAALLGAGAVAATLGLTGAAIGTILLAMGAENATFQRDGEVTIGLTYVTGTLVKLGQRLAAVFYGGSRLGWLPHALLWLGLVAGAAIGGAVHARLGLNGLWPASAAAIVLAALSTRTRVRFR